MFVFGIAVFAGLLAYVVKAQNYRWRLLADSYASDLRRPPLAVKRFESFIATGGGWAWTHYVGVTIEVSETGLALRLFPPFFAPPLFLPFDEMKVRRTSWYLNTQSYALTMARGSGVEIILDDGLLGWIRRHSDRI